MAKLFVVLLDWMDSHQDIKGEILAINCVDLSKLRIKIYVRSQETSFDSVADMMTIDRFLTNDGIDKALTTLKDL